VCSLGNAQQHPPLLFFLEDSFLEDEAFLDDFFSFFASAVEASGTVVVTAAVSMVAAVGTGAAGSVTGVVVVGGCAGYAIIDGTVCKVEVGAAVVLVTVGTDCTIGVAE